MSDNEIFHDVSNWRRTTSDENKWYNTETYVTLKYERVEGPFGRVKRKIMMRDTTESDDWEIVDTAKTENLAQRYTREWAADHNDGA